MCSKMTKLDCFHHFFDGKKVTWPDFSIVSPNTVQMGHLLAETTDPAYLGI